MSWRDHLNAAETADLAIAETQVAKSAEAYASIRKIRQICLQRARRQRRKVDAS